jgi:prevent-host-death family protein
MVRVATSQARKDFAETINQVVYRGERIVLHRRGKNLAAIVPIADLELVEALEDRMDVDAARKALKERGTNIPLKQIKKELGL